MLQGEKPLHQGLHGQKKLSEVHGSYLLETDNLSMYLPTFEHRQLSGGSFTTLHFRGLTPHTDTLFCTQVLTGTLAHSVHLLCFVVEVT